MPSRLGTCGTRTMTRASARSRCVLFALFALASACVAAQPADAPPEGADPPAAAEPTATAKAAPDSPAPGLAARLAAAEAALRADTALDAQRRAAIGKVLERLTTTVRAIETAGAWLAAEGARGEERATPGVVDVDAAFERWRAALPEQRGAAELWPMLARLGEELRALRRQERHLFADAPIDEPPDRFAVQALWTPVAIESLTAALPDAPAYLQLVTTLARDVETERLATALLVEEARSDPVERVDRMRRERGAIESRVALVQREMDYVAQELANSIGDALDLVKQVALGALQRLDAGSPTAARARDVLALAADAESLHARNTVLEQQSIEHAEALDAIVRLSEDTRERIAVQGATHAIGLVLVQDLARTLPPERIANDLGELRRELADVQMGLVDLRGRIVAASDPYATVSTSEILARLRAVGGTDEGLLASMQFRLLVLVEAASQAVAAAMRGEEATLAELERRNRELRALITGRLLWTRSHAPVDRAWFTQVADRFGDGRALATPLRIAALATRDALASLGGSPLRIAALLALVAAWAALAWWHRRTMLALATRGVQTLGQAVGAIMRPLVLALPIALALVGVLRSLRGGEAPSGFYGSVVHGTGWTSWTVLLLVTMLIVAVGSGAGSLVLGWRDATRRGLRNLALALLLLIVPSHIGVTSAWYRGDLATLQYESRAVFMLAWLGVALVLWHALRPAGLWPEWQGLLRRVLRIALTFAPLSAVVASLMGYQITALAIAHQVEGTIGVLATLLVAHGLATRAVALAAQREAERHAVQQRLASMEGVDPAMREASLPPEPERDPAAGYRLVGTTIAVIAAVWLAVLWSGLLPAIRQLDEITLWQVAVGSGESERQVPISLLDVIGAVAAAVLFGAALRVVPGVVEAMLRDRTHVDAGTRYAVGAMLRYTIVLVGVVATFGLIGVRWSHLQWMAAALTVGLGFGLQEIFGNFVSGLILLFERPVRVGDVVTVGDVTGTVTKIRTRATTVLDFDRREIMIPNKALITDRLVNWTLTSGLTRITVKVGVAYGTDPELVHRLLRQAAAETEAVLDEPAPLTIFVGFGKSNLEFELRACVGHFDDRLPASNELYARIASSFEAAGVRMSYDQMEVRVLSPGAEAGAPARATRRRDTEAKA